MRTHLRLATIISAGVATVVLGLAAPASAGRGGSATKIEAAARSGSVDAIVAEVERAERLTCDACTPIVMELLDHDRYEVREVAAWWFARRAKLRVELAERATTDLAGTDSRLARNGADLLGAFMHPAAIPALTGAIGRADLAPEARLAAARALGMIGHPNGRAGLTTALGDADASVRLEAVNAWIRLRTVTDAAPVVALVADADARVRAAAAGAVGTP
ncbi:MAG: HEAT repeat domain-containing protein [Kofleriaceae bacterium]